MGREFPVQPLDSTGELLVVARLVDRQACPSSVEKHYGLVMKYEVIEVVSGFYDGNTIYVCHGAPELPRFNYFKYCGSLPSFEVGASHRLRLKEKLQENPSPFELVVDPYKEPGVRYLCLKADMAEGPDATQERHSDDEEEDYTLYSEGELGGGTPSPFDI